MGLAKQRHPVVIELKAEVTPVRVRQYPMSQEARWGNHSPHSMAHECRNSQAVPIPLEHPLTTGEEAKEYGL